MTVIGAVSNGELAVILQPGSDLVGAVLVGEDLNLHILQSLVVGQAPVDGVIKLPGFDGSGVGSDGGQTRQDLELHNITSGAGGCMGEAVIDVIGTAVGAGVLHGLSNFLSEFGNAGVVFRVDDHIVVPEVTTFGGCGVSVAGNRSHRQTDKERIGSGSDHFRHLGFDAQPQAQIQVALDGLAIFIGLVHDNGFVAGSDIGFQGILDGGGIGFQSVSQSLVQHIGLVVPAVSDLGDSLCVNTCFGIHGSQRSGGFVVQHIGILVAASTVTQTDSGQQISSLILVKGIQNLSQVVVGMLVVGGLGEGHDIGNTQDGEFHTLQSVAVGVLTVAQRMVGIAVGIALTDGFAQDFFHIALAPAGGDEGVLIPDTVLVGVGPVKLPDGQGCLGILVNGAVIHLGGKGCGNTGQHHHQCQTDRKQFLQIFHKLASSFRDVRIEIGFDLVDGV